jgi:hypothetical protein
VVEVREVPLRQALVVVAAADRLLPKKMSQFLEFSQFKLALEVRRKLLQVQHRVELVEQLLLLRLQEVRFLHLVEVAAPR